MAQQILASTRRDFLGGTMGSIALGLAPGLIGSAQAADDFKIGLFYAQSGPASLFGPTQLASAQLAVDEVNKAGGIMGRQIKLFPTDAGGPPADTTTRRRPCCAPSTCRSSARRFPKAAWCRTCRSSAPGC